MNGIQTYGEDCACDISECVVTESESTSNPRTAHSSFPSLQILLPTKNTKRFDRKVLYKTDPNIAKSDRVIQNPPESARIYFDKCASFNKQIWFLSSKCLRKGYYEWMIQILECGVDRQEIGIISVPNINGIGIDKGGLSNMPRLGARAVFGSVSSTNSMYYAS
eukprot:390592_1